MNNNRKSLWNAIDIAHNDGLPMLGILKDVQTGHCSLSGVFSVADVVYEKDGSVLWLLLNGEVGADHQRITAAAHAS